MRTIDEVMAEEGLDFVAAVEVLAKEADIHSIFSLEKRITTLEADVETRIQILDNLNLLNKRLTALNKLKER